MGVAGGLTQTGKSFVGGDATAQGESMPKSIPGGSDDEVRTVVEALKDSASAESRPTEEGKPENTAPRRPRKIEVRSGNIGNMKDEPKVQIMSTDDSQKGRWEGVQPLDGELKPPVLPVQRLGFSPEPTT
jgi:hypothetical protein